MDDMTDYMDLHPTDGRPMTGAPIVDDIRAKLDDMISDAIQEAHMAAKKYPQPNYIISKVAEECGEVVKAAIHCAEKRDTPEHVRAEIVQAMAMLIRLYLEGDQVHGLPSIAATT